MQFGPFPEEHCFCIDRSSLYQRIQKEVKMADFLLLKERRDFAPVVWVVEAKSSNPHTEANLSGLNNYISEIGEKLENAVNLWLALGLGRHGLAKNELPAPLRDPDLSAIGFRLVLVIRDCENADLPQLQDALLQRLRRTIHLWAMGANVVVVMNEKMARKHGLIRLS